MIRRSFRSVKFAGLAAALLTVFLVPSVPAQEAKFNSLRIQAVAMGTSTQLGRITNVTITIRELSTEEDRTALLQAFQQKGSQGLARALGKMPSCGRIAITGTIGYDINYARIIDTPNGRILRFVTDRPVDFREVWTSSRSQDYNLSAGEIELSGEKGKGAGTLLPACEFKMDKDNQLTIDLRRNAWKLTNVDIHE